MDEETRRRRRELAHRRTIRRRRLTAAAGFAAVVLLFIVLLAGGGDGNRGTSRRAAAAPRPPELPRGGRTILPGHRVVALYGAPEDPQLGELGIGSPDQAAAKLERQARPYAGRGVPVLPAFELLATVAAHSPGPDGLYRSIQPDSVISRYLHAARRHRALLILDIQPGYESFIAGVRRLGRYLAQPDVELALDPEWSLRAPDIPGQKIGSTDASDVNAATAYLSDVVTRFRLPQKLLLVHQFTPDMIANRSALREAPGVALTLNVDGFGTPPDKVARFRSLARRQPRFHVGFKLFYHEDTGLMTPRQALRLRPQPEVFVYE